MFMKKFLSLLIAVIAICVNAQTYESPRFIDNTYVRISGGATALTHPRCLGYENWGHSIQAVIGAEVGKWVTPKFGVAFAGDFGILNGSKRGLGTDQKAFNGNRFNYITVTGLVKGNLTNIFNSHSRLVEVVAATGPMWIYGFPGKNHHNDFGVKFQAEVNFNVAERLQVNLIPEFNYNLTGLYSRGTNEHPRFDSRNSWYGLQVGLTYKIGKQFTEHVCSYSQADVDALNAEINKLRNQKPSVVEVEKIVKVTEPVDTYVVNFDYNSSTLDNVAMAILNDVPANSNVRIVGEASTPGAKSANDRISKQRAKAVANYLNNRGINVVSTEGIGATGRQIVTITIN